MRNLALPSLFQFSLLALALGVACVRAESVPALVPAEVVRFSTAEVPPWGYLDEAGTPRGTLIELAQRLQEITSLPIHNQIRPYPRTIHEIEKGVVDFAVMFAGPSSDRIGIDVGTVVQMDVLVTGRPDHPPVQSLNDLAGKSVGYIRGSLYGPLFDQQEQIDKLPVKDMQQGLQMLMMGRIDAMVGTDQALYNSLHEMGMKPADVKPLLVIYRTEGKLYFSRASKRTQWIEPIRAAIETMRKQGELDRLFALPGEAPADPLPAAPIAP